MNIYENYTGELNAVENIILIKSNCIKQVVAYVATSGLIAYAIKKTQSAFPLLGLLFIPHYYVSHKKIDEEKGEEINDELDNTDDTGAESEVWDPGRNSDDPGRETSDSDTQESSNG